METAAPPGDSADGQPRPGPTRTHLQEQHDRSADDGHQLPYQPDFILLRHVGLLGDGVQDEKCFLSITSFWARGPKPVRSTQGEEKLPRALPPPSSVHVMWLPVRPDICLCTQGLAYAACALNSSHHLASHLFYLSDMS